MATWQRVACWIIKATRVRAHASAMHEDKKRGYKLISNKWGVVDEIIDKSQLTEFLGQHDRKLVFPST